MLEPELHGVADSSALHAFYALSGTDRGSARRIASNITKLPHSLVGDNTKDELHQAEKSQGAARDYDDERDDHVPPARLWHTVYVFSLLVRGRQRSHPIAEGSPR